MARINLLPKQVSELIAAGEVVERPSSVIKELVENSIDAGATAITVEITSGGITYMRITDNGGGIAYDDVPLAFLRHATSKIKTETDLDSITTLGFRGEALAAVSSVARIELFTKTEGDEFGTHYIIEGGEQIAYDEEGCPDGTTIIVRDLFFNTPARMKFLKKDSSEGNAVDAVVDRIALSHPEIAFKLIREGKQVLSTSGDGKLKNTVYSVLGREFTSSLIDVEFEGNGVTVKGFVTKPVACKNSRNYQYTFLNNRLVKSATVMAAVEQAFKNSAMIGKFPGFVLNLTVPFETVDVNIHPAKTEVRFADEKRIFDAVYAAVKNSLMAGDSRPEIKVSKPSFNSFERMSTQQFRQQTIDEAPTAEIIYPKTAKKEDYKPFRYSEKPSVLRDSSKPAFLGVEVPDVPKQKIRETLTEPTAHVQKENEEIKIKEAKPTEAVQIRLIGEAFKTYIIVEKNESVFMIDKHAAHERILFNELKSKVRAGVQPMLTPLRVNLHKEEYDALISNLDLLNENGFEVEDFGNGCVTVRAVPANLTDNDIEQLMSELALSLKTTSSVQVERLDDIYHTVACKAAIKAGSNTSDTEKLELAQKVLSSNDIMYCPHGRPVAFELKKKELEKQFGRIQ